MYALFFTPTLGLNCVATEVIATFFGAWLLAAHFFIAPKITMKEVFIMKRILALLLALSMLFALTGCGEKALTFADVAIVDSDENILVEYGMKQEVVERYLGSNIDLHILGGEDKASIMYKYSDNLSVYYRNGADERRVAMIHLDMSKGTDLMTSRGITAESTIKDIIKAYGKEYITQPETGYDRYMIYSYDTKQKKFLKKHETTDTDRKEIINIDFEFEDDLDAKHNKLAHITLGDKSMVSSHQ